VPHSSHLSLTMVMEHVSRLHPTRVLDIGAGYGKWGYLVREALDFIPGRLQPSTWQVEIDGLEIFPTGSPLAEWVYDRMLVGNALDMLGTLREYDLVILGDVIEHFTKADGLRLLRTLLEQNRNVIVVTPMDFFEQNAEENAHEQHLSLWSQDDFAEWPHDYEVVGGSIIVALLAGKGATYPTMTTARVSRAVYRLPGMSRRGASARLLKDAVSRGLRASPLPKSQ
jgi:hypothetical protein